MSLLGSIWRLSFVVGVARTGIFQLTGKDGAERVLLVSLHYTRTDGGIAVFLYIGPVMLGIGVAL